MRLIGVDLDGVVADHVTPLLRRLPGSVKPLKYQDVRSLQMAVGGTNIRSLFLDAVRDPEYLRSVALYPDSAQALRALREHGFMIALLTARPDYAKAETILWLQRYHLSFDVVHFTEEGRKGGFDAMVLIDDLPVNVLAFLTKGTQGQSAYLVRRPWNLDYSYPEAHFPGKLALVDSLASAVSEVISLSESQ